MNKFIKCPIELRHQKAPSALCGAQRALIIINNKGPFGPTERMGSEVEFGHMHLGTKSQVRT